MFNLFSQKLLFITGKGGVGKTSLAVALGLAYARRKQRTLVVQWAIEDGVSPLLGRELCGHSAQEVSPFLYTMNFQASQAVKEYFVDHLKMRLLFEYVIQNKHVQKLIQVAPGFQELFFLGRLFWLVKLQAEIQDTPYDKIIVDAPSTGHGLSLLGVAQTIASFGMTGPLAHECERVSSLLQEPQTVGVICVTLPEELPMEETLEFLPQLRRDLGRDPLAIALNRCLPKEFFHLFQNGELPSQHLFPEENQEVKTDLDRFGSFFGNRIFYEQKLLERNWGSTQIWDLPEVLASSEPSQVVTQLSHCFEGVAN